MTQSPQVKGGFNDLGVSPKLLVLLAKQKILKPTPIQEQCIPLLLQEKDMIGIAQTGTGKTFAYGLPIIQLLAKNKGQALIMVPTRELALQVDEALQSIGRSIGLKTVVIIGGSSSYQQKQALRRNPHIIISTPGRLIDHLNQRNLHFNNVKIVVLDEADRMLDIGFLPDIKKILNAVKNKHQTMLFSATMPQPILDLSAQYTRLPLRIEVAPSGTAAKNVEQELFIVSKPEKMEQLDKLLKQDYKTVLLFVRTKISAKRITASLNRLGHKTAEIHSNRSLYQRKEALAGFKAGKYRILVATDIAARGIDVSNISLVVNYDLPDDLENYVHRVGRTGRASNYGKAISFVAPEERYNIKNIERLIKKTIPVKIISKIAAPIAKPKGINFSMHRRNSRRTGFSRGRSRSRF